MITIILIAFIIGAVASMPLGALGVYMFERMEKDGFRAGLSIGLTAAFVDTFYCAITLFGITLVIGTPVLHFIVQLVGLILLLYVGVKYLFIDKKKLRDFKSQSIVQKSERMSKILSHFQGTVVVFILTFSNPTLLAFWVNMANLLHGSILKNGDILEYLVFSVSVGFGSAFCQYCALRFIQKVHHSNVKMRALTRWIGSTIFIITIVYFGIQVVKSLEIIISNHLDYYKLTI